MTLPEVAPQVTVRGLMEDPSLDVGLRVVAGKQGIDRLILHPRVQKSGLALVGHSLGIVATRVQLLGETELSYVDSLDDAARRKALQGFFALDLCCVILTRNTDDPHPVLMEIANTSNTPLLVSDARTSRTINAVHNVLDARLAPRTTLHGVLVDVFGVGLLLLGKSGVGKSECALELIMRGHRLVADDVVECDWRPPGMVFGTAPDLLRNHLEIRGLGVLNIHDLFGVTSVTPRKRIDVVVRLTDWNDTEPYDRLGIDDKSYDILGASVRELSVPVRPGRDMGTILEVAARGELLRREGRGGAHEFLGKLEAQLMTAAARPVAPESTVPAAVRPGRPGAYAMHESSAHLPAVRPREEEEEK
jgi:HPr kinase/phosphorylase